MTAWRIIGSATRPVASDTLAACGPQRPPAVTPTDLASAWHHMQNEIIKLLWRGIDTPEARAELNALLIGESMARKALEESLTQIPDSASE